MILLDTSVWIDFFRQDPSVAKEVKLLLRVKSVLSFEPVFSELLVGARNETEEKVILSFWEVLPRVQFSSGSLLEAARYAGKRNLIQWGIGLMDAVIIKAVLDGNHLLWTGDKRILNFLEPGNLYKIQG